MTYYVYLLRCADNSLYAGITTDPARRFAQHAGKLTGGAKYTASHPPKRMEAVWQAADRSAASRLEHRLKSLTRAQKEQLLDGELPKNLSPDAYPRVNVLPDGTKQTAER